MELRVTEFLESTIQAKKKDCAPAAQCAAEWKHNPVVKRSTTSSAMLFSPAQLPEPLELSGW